MAVRRRLSSPSEDIPGQWWGLFRSNELNALITQALKANPDVDAAQASLRQANETPLRYAQGSLFPTFTGNGSANNQRYSGAAQGSQGTTAVFGVTSASLNVSYVPDLWVGRAGRSRFPPRRPSISAGSLKRLIHADVERRGDGDQHGLLRAQIAATEAIIKLETDALNLVQTQFNPAARRTDVLQQQATLTQTQATLPPLRSSLPSSATP